jgi:hypothetical protein
VAKKNDVKGKKVVKAFAKRYFEKSININSSGGGSGGSSSYARSKKLVRKSIKALRKISLERSRTSSSASSSEFPGGQEDAAAAGSSTSQNNNGPNNLVLSVVQPTQAVTFALIPPVGF